MWTPSIRHPRSATRLFTALLALSLASTPAFAETEIPANVELTQPTPAPTPQDRKEGSSAAMGLAIAGAAIAGASCAMLMKQAQEAPTESERNMLMAMAMQQCSQAAQNMANAGENEKGKDGLTSPQTPGPSLKSEPQKTAETKAQPTFAPTEAVAEATPEMEIPTPAMETASGVVSPDVFNGTKVGVPDEKIKLAAKGPSTSVPKVIPKNGVEFDDEAKLGEGSTTPFGSPQLTSTFGQNMQAQANKDLKKLLDGSDPREARGNGKHANEDGYGEGAGGSGEGKEGKTGDSDMSAMLAQLMGGGAPAAADGVPSNQLLNLKEFARANGGAPEDIPNIFQYASYKYHQLKQERAVEKGLAPVRSLAAKGRPVAMRSGLGASLPSGGKR